MQDDGPEISIRAGRRDVRVLTPCVGTDGGVTAYRLQLVVACTAVQTYSTTLYSCTGGTGRGPDRRPDRAHRAGRARIGYDGCRAGPKGHGAGGATSAYWQRILGECYITPGKERDSKLSCYGLSYLTVRRRRGVSWEGSSSQTS